MRKINLENVIWQEDKYFVVQCLNVDVSSFGATKEEALNNLNEALGLYFEDIEKPMVLKVEKPELVETFLAYA